MSLDQISPITRDIDDILLLLNVIKGRDEKDPTSFESKEIKIPNLNNLKIGFLDLKCDKEIYNFVWNKTEELCEKKVWKINKIKTKYIDLAIQTYYPICYAEFFSGTRKFDGRRFGKKIEDSCGEEVLRRILGGKEISQAEHKGRYYRQALNVKRLITKEFDKIFEKYDAIILPTIPKLPHKIGSKISIEDMYSYDAMTIPANLAGIPAMTIPIGKINNAPIGLQIMCKRFDESKMISIARNFFLFGKKE
jgi:aspartyl-tRNA(Asn)/glutamyl-tRNA(Gln) amidotransferase subunit A